MSKFTLFASLAVSVGLSIAFVVSDDAHAPEVDTAPVIMETEAAVEDEYSPEVLPLDPVPETVIPEPEITATPGPMPEWEGVLGEPQIGCPDGYTVDENFQCVLITEDSPLWDCRTMGNQVCSVQIKGEWYLIAFSNGWPMGVAPRDAR